MSQTFPCTPNSSEYGWMDCEAEKMFKNSTKNILRWLSPTLNSCLSLIKGRSQKDNKITALFFI